MSNSEKNVLICDIGGTNVRFGIYTSGQNDTVKFDGKYKCTQFTSFEEGVGFYLNQKKAHPKLCVIGAAGGMDPDGKKIVVTNTPWKADVDALKKSFPFFDHIRLENDFALQGWALSGLKQDQYRPVFSDKNMTLKKGNIVVIGPGTGLGSCFLTQRGRKAQEIHTAESGHATLPHVDFHNRDLNRCRDRVLSGLSDFYSPKTPVVEHIVSGTGISNVYHLCTSYTIPADKRDRISAEEVEHLAQQGDKKALMTFQIFNSYMGAHAGTLAVTLKSNHIFFCGGLMASPWVLGNLETTPEFMKQFTARAALTESMKEVHFSASLYRDMSTLGAVVRAKQLLDLKRTEDKKERAAGNLLNKLKALQAAVRMEGGEKAHRGIKTVISAIEQYQKAEHGRGLYTYDLVREA